MVRFGSSKTYLSPHLFITDRSNAVLLLWFALIQFFPFMSLLLHDFVATRISFGCSPSFLDFTCSTQASTVTISPSIAAHSAFRYTYSIYLTTPHRFTVRQKKREVAVTSGVAHFSYKICAIVVNILRVLYPATSKSAWYYVIPSAKKIAFECPSVRPSVHPSVSTSFPCSYLSIY